MFAQAMRNTDEHRFCPYMWATSAGLTRRCIDATKLLYPPVARRARAYWQPSANSIKCNIVSEVIQTTLVRKSKLYPAIHLGADLFLLSALKPVSGAAHFASAI